MVLSDELSEAAQQGADAHFARITAYLIAGGDVNDVDVDGETMLYLNITFEGTFYENGNRNKVRIWTCRSRKIIQKHLL